MIVNKEVIKSFNPCVEGWQNYLKHYSDFNGSFDDFIDLENIPYDDKIWLAKKMLNKNQMVHFGILCAESVLCNFEEKFPEDKRVRECLETLKAIPDFNNLTEENLEKIRSAESAAWSAAWSARSAVESAWSAWSAAWSARSAVESAWSARSAAWSARSAVESAWSARSARSAAWSAAWSAESAAWSARSAAWSAQQSLNLEMLKMAASL